MNGLLSFVCTLLLSFSLKGQDIHPSSVVSFPNIHPDSLSKLEAHLKNLENGELGTTKFDDYIQGEGLYSTEPMGCSWYC